MAVSQRITSIRSGYAMYLLFTCRLIVVERMYRANQKFTNTVLVWRSIIC